jgi:glycosyltransferase involved in cell wall biosynthesis
MIEERRTGRDTSPGDVLLTVIVPVFNQEAAIVENVETIRRAIAAGLGAPFELIVVSDGSIDRTAERVLEAAGEGMRVIHYDRNLGKGYAIKVGALEASGRYVAYIDADLDLDPAGLPRFVEIAERESLDFAIGSKRHPDSDVHYPRSRRVASWLYQQLVRLLFQLDVRDTQVGLKVFHRDVAEQVLPLLLVKRFAFDLELLAVSRAFGFARIKELPIKLDYRFAGSGVRSLAVVRALVDTAAVFYRLRILRYYQRKRRLAGVFGWTRPRGYRPHVTVVATNADAVADLDYEDFDVVEVDDLTVANGRAAAERSGSEVIAFLGDGELPAGNWLSAAVPFMGRKEIAAVVMPRIAPQAGSRRERAAAGVVESRLGGGSLYFSFTPGNLRYVRDYPARSLVVRRERFLALERIDRLDDLVAALSAHGDEVLYTPETVLVAQPPPLFRPHLRWSWDYGRRRSRDLRRFGVGVVRVTTLLPLLLAGFLALGPALLVSGGRPAQAWLLGAALYLLALAAAGTIAAFRYRDVLVGLLTSAGIATRHVAYAGGFLRGLGDR